MEDSRSDRGRPTAKMACACEEVVLPVSSITRPNLLLLGKHRIQANQSTIPFFGLYAEEGHASLGWPSENDGLFDAPVEQVVAFL